MEFLPRSVDVLLEGQVYGVKDGRWKGVIYGKGLVFYGSVVVVGSEGKNQRILKVEGWKFVWLLIGITSWELFRPYISQIISLTRFRTLLYRYERI